MTIENKELILLALQGLIILLVTLVGYMMRSSVSDMKATMKETAVGVQDVQTQMAVFKESHHSLAVRVGSLEAGQDDLRKKHYDIREKILELKLNQRQAQGDDHGQAVQPRKT